MESQLQNPEFRINPENFPPMQYEICCYMPHGHNMSTFRWSTCGVVDKPLAFGCKPGVVGLIPGFAN